MTGGEEKKGQNNGEGGKMIKSRAKKDEKMTGKDNMSRG